MRIFLAPMEGVVDHHFRELLSAIGGIDICVTEFIRVNDLPMPPKTFFRECPELYNNSQTRTGTPVRVQLLGSNPDTVSQSAVTACSLGASAIDLNFGCPAKTVNNSKGGAVLLKEPQLVHTIVKQVRQSVPSNIPVTAKIRLGFEDRSLYLDNAYAIADAGANELCVHARSRADGYKPPAYWDYIGRITQAINIPVIANGDIWSLSDWQRCEQQSLCNDFMLGRGLLSLPDLALQIKANKQQTDHTPFSWQKVCGLLHVFYLNTKDTYPQRFLGNRVKQWLFYLQRNYPEAILFFNEIKRHSTQVQFNDSFAKQGFTHTETNQQCTA